MLGPLEIRAAGTPVELSGQRLRAFLALLLLTPGRPVGQDTLVAGIWGDSPPVAVPNALQALASRLRAALPSAAVVSEGSGYRLAVEPEQVDAHRFVLLAAGGRRALDSADGPAAAEAAADLLDQALGLWRGPAYAELTGSDVATGAVARLEELRLCAIEDRAEAGIRLGRHAAVAADLPEIIAANPLRERLRALHMRALYAAGRQIEALAAYQSARSAFADELGADPSPELSALHLAMLRRTWTEPVAREHAEATGADDARGLGDARRVGDAALRGEVAGGGRGGGPEGDARSSGSGTAVVWGAGDAASWGGGAGGGRGRGPEGGDGAEGPGTAGAWSAGDGASRGGVTGGVEGSAGFADAGAAEGWGGRGAGSWGESAGGRERGPDGVADGTGAEGVGGGASGAGRARDLDGADGGGLGGGFGGARDGLGAVGGDGHQDASGGAAGGRGSGGGGAGAGGGGSAGAGGGEVRAREGGVGTRGGEAGIGGDEVWDRGDEIWDRGGETRGVRADGGRIGTGVGRVRAHDGEAGTRGDEVRARGGEARGVGADDGRIGGGGGEIRAGGGEVRVRDTVIGAGGEGYLGGREAGAGSGGGLTGDGGVARGEHEGPAVRRGNLRARLTSFVGREREVAAVGELLRENRLVTLVGPGGAGKTRLAVESAESVAAVAGGLLPDGVWLVELASVARAADVASAVTAAMDVRGNPPWPVPEPNDPAERLLRALAGRRALIVLDNCEHVVEAAAPLAERVLAQCPGVRVLATSREPLGITGEVTLTLPPLALPPPGADPGAAADYPAVRLFADRAAAVRPGYRVADDLPAVLRICRELDGMPLAIELAAARLRSLTTAQIADRLDDRFRLLTGGSRTALPRHQTLRAVVEWSWDLLDDEERVLMRRLAVFAEGATLEAVEQVCSAVPAPAPGDVLDVLGRLVDKSLVVFDGGRYRMLETIRAYAAERLEESGEREAMRRAHAYHFAAFAEETDRHLRGHDQIARLAELSAEHDNLSAALRWALDGGHGPLALRMAGALGWYWFLRGHRLEGANRTQEALEVAGEDADPRLRAPALAVYALNAVGASFLFDSARDVLAEARRLAERAGLSLDSHPLLALAGPYLALFGDGRSEDVGVLDELVGLSDPWVVAVGRAFRVVAHLNRGDLEEGERDLRAALAGFREIGDAWGTGMALSSLAELHFLRGEAKAANDVTREALALLDRLGAVEDTPYLRARLALSLNTAGEREAAVRMLEEVTELVRRNGDVVGEAGIQGAWGDFARQDGDFEAARGHYVRALTVLDRVSAPPPHLSAALHAGLALVAVQEEDHAAARRMLLTALDQGMGTADAQLIGVVLVAVAGWAAATADPGTAAALLGGVESVRGVGAVVDYDHVWVTGLTRDALTEDDFGHHYARGLAMTPDDVVALARTRLTARP
ncbi:hypothetical protein GCM10023259_079550 [Thermocatellispora tengchongensis]